MSDLKPFSLDTLTRPSADRYLSIVADVREDGDHLVLDPFPCARGPVVRVAREHVEIGAGVTTRCPDGSTIHLHEVLVRTGVEALSIVPTTVSEALEDFQTQRISIALGGNAEGTLTYKGGTVKCLGKAKMPYPKDVINSGVEGKEKFKSRYSSEYQVQMPWAILLGWQRGLFIHEGAATLATNDGESAGCIHVAAPEAEKLWHWMTGPTRITVTAPWL